MMIHTPGQEGGSSEGNLVEQYKDTIREFRNDRPLSLTRYSKLREKMRIIEEKARKELVDTAAQYQEILAYKRKLTSFHATKDNYFGDAQPNVIQLEEEFKGILTAIKEHDNKASGTSV